LLPPAVVGRLRHLDDAADVDDGLALGDQLLGGLELADDLIRRVPGAFQGRAVTARKDDAPAAGQAAINNVVAVTPFSGVG